MKLVFLVSYYLLFKPYFHISQLLYLCLYFVSFPMTVAIRTFRCCCHGFCGAIER